MAETATINGTDLAYIEPGRGQPVVLVHGGMGDYRDWDPGLLRTLVLLEPPAFPLLGVNIPPTPPQVLKLLARNPRLGIGFI